MTRATGENRAVTTSAGRERAKGHRPARSRWGADVSSAIVAVMLVVAGSIVALGIADITPSSALPRSIAAARTPHWTQPSTPPATPPSTVRTSPPPTTAPTTIGATTHVTTEPTVRLQDDNGDTTNPNADDSAGSGDGSGRHSTHKHDD